VRRIAKENNLDLAVSRVQVGRADHKEDVLKYLSERGREHVCSFNGVRKLVAAAAPPRQSQLAGNRGR